MKFHRFSPNFCNAILTSPILVLVLYFLYKKKMSHSPLICLIAKTKASEKDICIL